MTALYIEQVPKPIFQYAQEEVQQNFSSGSGSLYPLVSLNRPSGESFFSREDDLFVDLAMVYIASRDDIRSYQKQGKNFQPVISPCEKLVSINSAFGLAVSDYAKIFEVERQTYYNWLKGQDPKSDEHLSKIESLYKVSLEVSSFNSHTYGRLAKTHTYKGRKLLERLMDDAIDDEGVVEHCEQLTKMLAQKEKSRRNSAHGEAYFHTTVLIREDSDTNG